MLVGEGPGQNEDQQGLPFVGAAGQLLNKLLARVGIAREDVYITNIVKCRPPGNRDPLPQEVASCSGYLDRQIELIRPAVILLLGRHAVQRLLPGSAGSRASTVSWSSAATAPSRCTTRPPPSTTPSWSTPSSRT